MSQKDPNKEGSEKSLQILELREPDLTGTSDLGILSPHFQLQTGKNSDLVVKPQEELEMEEIKEFQKTLVQEENSKMQSEPCIEKETIHLKKE